MNDIAIDPASMLTAEQHRLLPDAADVRSYHEHGYWISPVILSDEVLDAADRGMSRFYAGEHDRPPVVVDGAWTGGDGLRKNDYASRSVTELDELVRQPVIAATAALLAGTNGIRLWHDQLLYKPVDHPGTPTNVGWHTDRQYWLSCSSDDMLTAWVGFHDVDEERGSVSFVRGSHRWEVDDLDFFDPDLARLEDRLRDQEHPLERHPTRMRRGQVSFHHCRTIHGSGPNRGTAPRRSIAIHLQPQDNAWRRHELPNGTLASHSLDTLVRTRDGVPDYGDPQFCPVLWPAGSEPG